MATISSSGMALKAQIPKEEKVGATRCESVHKSGQSYSDHQQHCAYRRERISSGALSWIGDEACCSRFLGPIGCPSCITMYLSHLCNGLESQNLSIEVLIIACLPARQAMV